MSSSPSSTTRRRRCLILGEFPYELRAALDNALYAVAIIDSGQNPPPNASQLEWPICSTPESWEGHRRRRLSALSEDLVNDLYLIQDLDVRTGPVGDHGTLATFTWQGDFDITPDYLDGETEFDVEVAGVELAPGPNSPEPMRPWGSLEKRLRSLHRAVTEYVDGLGHAVDLRDTSSNWVCPISRARSSPGNPNALSCRVEGVSRTVRSTVCIVDASK